VGKDKKKGKVNLPGLIIRYLSLQRPLLPIKRTALPEKKREGKNINSDDKAVERRRELRGPL